MTRTTDKHCRDCGAAVNVKTHGMRGRLQAAAGDADDYDRETAWHRVERDWWRDADRIAKDCGYAGAAACGRSGGWCAPYYSASLDGRTRYTFADVENDAAERERFDTFAGRIEDALRRVPDMFAEALRDIATENADAETEAAARTAVADESESDAHNVASIAADLARTLRDALDTIDACGSIDMGAARATLARWDTMRPRPNVGDIATLRDLQHFRGLPYALVTDSQDVAAILDHAGYAALVRAGFNRGNVSGVVALQTAADYLQIWATDGQRPFALSTDYTCVYVANAGDA
jgi:hypothetical protein